MTEKFPSPQPAHAGFVLTPAELLQSIADSSSDPNARGFAAAMLAEAAAVPEATPGWRLVPVDPTEIMVAMGSDARDLQEDDCDSANLATNTRATWAEMLRAAPLPPAVQAPEGGQALTGAALAEMWRLACADWNAQVGAHPDPWELFAARLAAQPQAIDVERLIRECLPGGHSCDPQAVADTIREWARAQQTKEPTNDR